MDQDQQTISVFFLMECDEPNPHAASPPLHTSTSVTAFERTLDISFDLPQQQQEQQQQQPRHLIGEDVSSEALVDVDVVLLEMHCTSAPAHGLVKVDLVGRRRRRPADGGDSEVEEGDLQLGGTEEDDARSGWEFRILGEV